MSFILNPHRFATGGGGSTYLSEVMADSPMLLWKLDETSGTTATDSSGNGRNGTYNGSPTLASAGGYPDASSVVYFPASGSPYVQSNANLVSDGSFTVECWFNRDTVRTGFPGGINSLVGDLVSVSNGLLVRWNSDSATTATIYIPNGSSYSTLTVTLNLDTLYHLAVVSTGSLVTVYVNGSSVNSGSISAVGWNLPWRVARSEDGRYLNGSVGWVAVYPTALSGTRIADHYAAA